MNEFFKHIDNNETSDESEDELLNVQPPVYDAEPLDRDYRVNSLEDDVLTIEEKVDTIVKALRQMVQGSGCPTETIPNIPVDKKSRKALGLKLPKASAGTPVTIVFDHPSITINLPDSQAKKRGDKG